MFCIKQQAQYHVYVEQFKEDFKFHDRKTRQQNLQSAVQEYAARLEYYCIKAPLQWFNFFSFWSSDQSKNLNQRASTESDIGIS